MAPSDDIVLRHNKRFFPGRDLKSVKNKILR